jgi:hypothetical protein
LPGALTEAAHQAKKGATYAGKTLVSGESDE